MCLEKLVIFLCDEYFSLYEEKVIRCLLHYILWLKFRIPAANGEIGILVLYSNSEPSFKYLAWGKHLL